MANYTIILEAGNKFARAGIAGDRVPRFQEQSNKDGLPLLDWSTPYSTDVRERYQVGIVELLERVIKSEKSINLKGRKVVVLERPLLPRWQKDILTSTLVERYQARATNFLSSIEAIACATGKRTALILDFGHDELSVVPFVNGGSLWSAMSTTTRSGRSLGLDTEKACTDGRVPSSQDALEHLFRDDTDERGVAQTILESVLKCPIEWRKVLMSNIILAGGLAKMPEMSARVQEGLGNLLTLDLRIGQLTLNQSGVKTKTWWHASRYDSLRSLAKYIRVISPEGDNDPIAPDCLAWVGASLLAAAGSLTFD